MTVEQLIEELRAMPSTSRVGVRIRANVNFEGALEGMEDERDEDVLGVNYAHGEVSILLDEPEYEPDEEELGA